MRDNSVLLITGTSRGIGKYLAEYYVKRGLTVVGCSRSKPETETAPNYLSLTADIRVESEVVSLVTMIRERFGRLDIAINNAAVNPALSLSLMTSMAATGDTFNTNVLGTFAVSREAAKVMMRRKFGRIINIGSMAARHEVPGEAIYSASKSAIHTLTRVMAKELYPHGITCNVVAPSAIETDMMKAIDPAALKDVLARNAIPHVGTFSDVSHAIDFLIQPESQAITGQILYLGGA